MLVVTRKAFAGLIILLLTGLTGTPRAESMLTYVTSLSQLDDSHEFTRIASVSVGQNGREICVTDEGSGTLQVFRSNLVHEFQTSRISGISSPRDAAIDASGGFVLTDQVEGFGRTIKRLNYLGEPVAYEPERPNDTWHPGHLLILHDGNYLTVDERTDLIVKHDSESGAVVWERPVAEAFEDRQAFFGRPTEGLDGRIYVPAGDFRRILVLSPDGETVTSFGKDGTGRGGLTLPVGVALGPDETLLVLDRLRHTVLIYDSEFNFVDEYTSFGDMPGGFYHPISIASLPDGRVCVAQGHRGRVQFFRFRQSLSGSDGAGVISTESREDGCLAIEGFGETAPQKRSVAHNGASG